MSGKSFSASMVPQIYKLSAVRLAFAVKRYGKENAESLRCTYTVIFQYFFEEIGGYQIKTKVILHRFTSDWVMIGKVQEAF